VFENYLAMGKVPSSGAPGSLGTLGFGHHRVPRWYTISDTPPCSEAEEGIGHYRATRMVATVSQSGAGWLCHTNLRVNHACPQLRRQLSRCRLAAPWVNRGVKGDRLTIEAHPPAPVGGGQALRKTIRGSDSGLWISGGIKGLTCMV